MDIEQLLKETILSIRASTYSEEKPSTEIQKNLGNIFLYVNRNDYKKSQELISLISKNMHNEDTDCIPFLTGLFIDIFNYILTKKTTSKDFLSDHKDTKVININEIIMSILKSHNSKYLRFSEFEIPIEIKNTEEVYMSLREHLNYQISVPMDENEINSDHSARLMYFSIARQLSKKMGYLNEVYLSLNGYIHQINRTSNFQLARDTCEEILLTSMIDNHRPYGLITYFNCFVSQKNIIDSLIYGNTLLFSLVDSSTINKDIYSEIVFITFTLFRNFMMFDIADEIHDKYLLNLDLDEYHLQRVENSYLSMHILRGNKSSLKIIHGYMSTNIDKILSFGVHSVVPSYNLLLNAKQLGGYDESGLGVFEEKLSLALGDEKENFKFVPSDDDLNIKNKLISQLNKLSKTRNTADLVSESNLIKVTANVAFNQSVDKNDPHLFLMAHFLNSDLSVAFDLSVAPEQSLIDSKFSTKITTNKFDKYLQYILSVTKEYKDDTFIWLASSGGNVLYLSLRNSTFSKVKIQDSCTFSDISSWKKNKLSSFGFEDSTKVDGVNYTYDYLPDDVKLSQCNNVLESLPSIVVNYGNHVYVFMTNELSTFPTNLLKISNDVLLASKAPVTTPLSFDNFSKNKTTLVSIEKLYLWSPVKEGDYSINMAYSKVQDSLRDYKISYDEELIPSHTNKSDINMFIAHGRSGNEGLSGLYASDSKGYIADTIRIFATGKVAILFICHSGSSGKSLFFNKANSIIKELISSKYESVIAPAWSLNVLIPGEWSKAFFNSMDTGKSINTAVYDANMVIKNKFYLPTAWACMHLYGNSNVKIRAKASSNQT